MQLHSMFGTGIFLLADNGQSGLLSDVVRILWLVAGTAMLLFAVFLAILIVAGIAFRLWPCRYRRRPPVVFGMSTVLVLVATTALVLPGIGWSPSASRAAARPGGTTNGAKPPGFASGTGVRQTTVRSLVLYDQSGADPKQDEVWATMLANLVSHFGGWDAHPVQTYRAGEMDGIHGRLLPR